MKQFLVGMLAKMFLRGSIKEDTVDTVDTKKWWQSKTVLAGIATVALSVYQLVLVNLAPVFGWQLPAIPDWLVGALSTVLGGVTIYGRTTATTAIKMLVVALLAGAFLFPCKAMADDAGVYFKFGQVQFTYPLAHVSATPAMLDWGNAQSLTGIETSLASWPSEDITMISWPIIDRSMKIPAKLIDLDFGGAFKPFEPKGIPYGGFNLQIAKLLGAESGPLSYIGGWAGHDFTTDDKRVITNYGVKASIPVW